MLLVIGILLINSQHSAESEFFKPAIPINFYSESKSECAISKVIGIGIRIGIQKNIFDLDWLKKHENTVITVIHFSWNWNQNRIWHR